MPDQLKLFLVEPPEEEASQSGPLNPALPDAVERELALDIHRSWIVEAPAGSGKTGLLIQRYLRLLADPSVQTPEQVLAVTFTNKATAELRDRVVFQLQSAASGAVPQDEFDRATRPLAEAVLKRDQTPDRINNAGLRWSLVDNPRRLNVRTIDSLCSEIARLLPILSGSGGGRSPVVDAAPLYTLAARRTFLQLGGPDTNLHDALSLVLLHRDGNLGACERLLAEMLELREQWGELLPLRRDVDDAWLDAHVLPRLEGALNHVICAGLTEFSAAVPEPLLERLAAMAAEMAHLDGYKGADSPIAFCAGRSNSPRAISEDLDHWRALAELLVTKDPAWRKSFSAYNLGFEVPKSEQARLKSELSSIINELRQNPTFFDAIVKLRALPAPTYPQNQWQVAKALFRILTLALVELQLVFAERGQCDFAEVSLAARTALDAGTNAGSQAPNADHGPGSSLEAAFGVRLQHLLVDEMQDTSSSQYELIQGLTRGWDGYSQTVFLVGDPKQSIYLFRQARVVRFLRTMRSGQLGDLPLECLHLTANFRSQASLVSAFNDDFALIFPPPSATFSSEDIPYRQAFAARPASNLEGPALLSSATPRRQDEHRPGTFGLALAAAASSSSADLIESSRVWHLDTLPYVAKQSGDTQATARSIRRQRLSDARKVRALIESWRNRPLPPHRASLSSPAPWKIAVLCRSRNHLDEIVAVLKQHPAIPFRAVDVDALKDRSEVQDLVVLTRALLHPADRVAWLALLRAPWCGLSLAELLILTGTDDPLLAERSISSLVAERRHLLPDESCRRLARVWPILEAAIRARGRLSLAQLVERTWRSLGGDAWLDPSQLANSTRYLQLLDEIDAELEQGSATFDLPLLERRLDKLYAAPAVHPDAVDLLTIHKAKGLEWDVVFVPGLERPPGSNRSRMLNWVELDSTGEAVAPILLAPIAAKGENPDPLYKWINSLCTGRERAEVKRLFYVACTRAREELHLFGAPVRSSGGGITPKPASLLAAAWPAAEPLFSNLAKPTEQQEDAEALDLAAAADPLENSSAGLDSYPAETAANDDSDVPLITALADDWDTSGDPRLAFPLLEGRATTIKRLPLAFDPAASFHNLRPLRYGGAETSPLPRFERPEGSVAARALGNAVHAFLELLTAKLAEKGSPEVLFAALPSWTATITATLRSGGLSPAEVTRLAPRVLSALKNALSEPLGLWLLSPHPGAATEYALTARLPDQAQGRTNIRLDRVFRAGPTPLAAGATHLWIVDYKSARDDEGKDSEAVDAFLAAEKTKYAPQLEAYAAVLRQASSPGEEPPELRLALYYPMLPKLIWWSPTAQAQKGDPSG